MEYGAVLHSPYYTLPEGMKFTLVVFSCKQYVDMVAARARRARICHIIRCNDYSAGTRYMYRYGSSSKEFCAW